MIEISGQAGTWRAEVGPNEVLGVDLIRFGESVAAGSVDLSQDALPPVFEAPSDMPRLEATGLVPDGAGGVWAIAGRYYSSEESGFGYSDVEIVAQRFDSDLAPAGDAGLVALSGAFQYIGYCALCEDYGPYPPRVSGTVAPDGSLLVAFGASPDQDSNYDVLPLGIAAFDGDTGEVIYQIDTGVRGEPVSVGIEGSGDSAELVVRSAFSYRDAWVSTFGFIYDYDEVELVADDLRVVTRHDPDTGEVLAPPVLESESSDAIFGYFGDDELTGTAGNDTMFGLPGNDRLDAGAGDDRVFGADGDDGMPLGPGDDTAYGGNGYDAIAGAAGDDYIDGGRGADRIGGGPGNDTILAGNGDDTVRGGTGNDEIRVYLWNPEYDDPRDQQNVLTGGVGRDTIVGANGDDRLAGGADPDFIRGLAGADVIGGGTGADTIRANGGHDTVYAGQGNDEVDGGANNDLLKGGTGNDTLIGGHGDDRLFGGPGDDVLTGDDANNPGGIDVFAFERLTPGDTDTITDFVKFDDRIEIAGLGAGTDAEAFESLRTGFAIGSDGEVGSFIRAEGHTIILDGINPNALGVEDFIFV